MIIIYNPNAGRGKHKLFNAVLDELDSRAVVYTILKTENPDHATKFLKENHNIFDLVVAVGGDGTISDVINGIAGSKSILAIIPIGTMNGVAEEIGLSRDAAIIADTIIGGKIKKYYLPKINGQYFTLMASAGYDANAVSNVNMKLKKKISDAAYFFSFMKAIFTTKNIKYEIMVDGKEYHTYGIIVSNSKYYGGKYLSAPKASIFDPYLYIVMLKKKGRLAVINYFFHIIIGRIDKLKHVEIITGNNVNIKSSDQATIQTDGDHFGDLPAQILLENKTIKIKTPT